ncbi:uncharacterized protein N7515_006261 [Penicillium bovifimosum]|uniref:Mucin-7 n=1 Tax=Penicillium bovifimosum TaxID=126998 RepID=A0A9W9GUH0_9EURO|nr:uncharacterized protein N7515_006261 [Penicillium bovifimosum]KAJ5130222.1 hypothetical protein N7515_006261 [Penicillium bovifimosum]
MPDNNPHHPGVRSLLAKFEGQSPIASPPSRGRSPAASDSSGTTRQLSKVRASFVTVDGVIQSNPASPLRKTSGRSDSPGIFGPKINSGDVDSGRQSTVSPTPVSRLDHMQNATMAQIMAEGRPNTETKAEPNYSSAKPTTRAETTSQLRGTSPKQPEDPSKESKSANSINASHQPDSPGTVKKKPSSVGSSRNAASKHVPATAASAAAKPNASTKSLKPTAREVAKERANSLTHKPSRVSLAAKTTARPTRGSTPAQDTSKPSVAGATNKAGTKSPPKSTRGAPTQASAARLGSTGASSTRTTSNTSTLTRKPSTLKSATGGQQRATTPTASVRRQSSRPSLPAQTTNDSTTKPVNESFLARMMRPTASSANKFQSQEKADTKPVSKAVSASKAPRPSIGKVPERTASQVKPKSNTLRPQNQKFQALRKEHAPQKDGPKAPEKRQESEKENIVEVEGTPASPEEPATVKSNPIGAVEQPEAPSKPVEEVIAPAQVEEPASEVAVDSIEPEEKSIEVPPPIVEETVAEISPEPVSVEDATETSLTEQSDVNETPVSVKADADSSVEASAEPVAEPVEEEKAAESTTTTEDAAAEPVATSNQTAVDEVDIAVKDDISAPEPQVLENPEGTEAQPEAAEKDDDVPLKEVVVPDMTEIAEEKPSVVKSTEPAATDANSSAEAESSNVAIDIANLALN